MKTFFINIFKLSVFIVVIVLTVHKCTNVKNKENDDDS